MFEWLMGLKGISPADLHQLMQVEPVTAFDVNSRQSWLNARVPGAMNLDPVGYDDKSLPADKDSLLVFYCSNPLCRKAPNAARRAKQMGYRNVHVMSAGISGWLNAKLPTESGERKGFRDTEIALRLPALMLLILPLASCVPARHSPSLTDSAYDLPAFARALDSLRTAARIPGLSAAVVKDGEVIFARGFGYADLERQIPATPDTPYDIASVTKPISAVVALRLVEEGLLDLDRPMAQYSEWADFCKDFSEQPSIFAQGLRCESPQHSLRHLLTHTAIGDPGAQFSYNPILYSWASRPMMEASGKPFSRLVEQYVFQPAGMARSARTNRDLPLREDLAAAIAIPYHSDSAGTIVRSPEREAQGDGAAGGVIATVVDLARFDVALDRGELISPASYTAMMRPMRSSTGESLPYSVGWFAQRHAGHELRWHSGWWDDAYSALYLKVPDENLTLILLANSEGIWWDNPLSSAQVQQSSFAQAFFRAFL